MESKILLSGFAGRLLHERAKVAPLIVNIFAMCQQGEMGLRIKQAAKIGRSNAFNRFTIFPDNKHKNSTADIARQFAGQVHDESRLQTQSVTCAAWATALVRST